MSPGYIPCDGDPDTSGVRGRMSIGGGVIALPISTPPGVRAAELKMRQHQRYWNKIIVWGQTLKPTTPLQ